MGMYDMLGFDPATQSGWIPPADRSTEMTVAHNAIIESTPILACSGPAFERPKWSVAWAHEDEVALADTWRRAGHMKNIRQNTGSCVGSAMTNLFFWSSIIDAIWFGDPTRILFPFTGYHYGLGRLRSGIRGRGEGSSGSGQAEEAVEDGFLAYDLAGLPAPRIGDVIDWPASVEMDWSDGANLPQQYLAEGRKHRFGAKTRITSVEQAVDLMASRYFGTTASNWGGLMQCPLAGEGNSRVLLNRRTGVWNHQQGLYGFWYHPTLALLLAIGNQWGYPHGDDFARVVDENTPPQAPPGIYWVQEKEFKYMIAAGETFIFTGTPNFDVRPGKYRMAA